MFLQKQRVWIWAAALWTLIQLPFLSGPFRIDDPYHLEAARQIRRAPSDPYGFEINWDGSPKPAFVTYASPPLVPAWLALWTCFFPANETSLHIAMLPFSLTAILTFGLLARSFEIRPWVAMALLACSPAFFLASQVLMPDLPMLCLFLIAVTGARLYQLQRTSMAGLLAFLSGFCCPLAKYNGAALVPVLICLGLPNKHAGQGDRDTGSVGSRLYRLGAPFDGGMIAILSAPVLALVCWGAYTWAKYGAVHFLKMSAFQRGQIHSLDSMTLTAGIVGAVGSGVVPLSLIGFLLRSQRRSSYVTWLAVASAFGAAWLATFRQYELSSILLFTFSASVAVYVLAITIQLSWRYARNADWAWISLAVWVLGGIGFQYGLMFSAVRYVLFLAPPVILLVLRRSSWTPGKNPLMLMLAANLIVVAVLGFADARQADVYRSVVADEIRPRLVKSGGRFLFDGHWGFQYYATQIGGEPIDELKPPALRAGDLVVVAKTAWPKLKHSPAAPGFAVESSVLTVPGSGWLKTISCAASANFYASIIADCERPAWLPFGFSSEPAERFEFYRVEKPAVVDRAVSQQSGK